jgi:hypothetical protein
MVAADAIPAAKVRERKYLNIGFLLSPVHCARLGGSTQMVIGMFHQKQAIGFHIFI